MIKSTWLRVVGGVLAGSLVIAGTAAAAGSAALSLETKQINGEVYVKANSVVQALGATGTYDAKTKTYKLTPAPQVPDVVKKVSPSVVAIIGKPNDGEEPGKENRYSLAHGTGVIYMSDGWIVTNAHVVKGMDHIVVVTADGKQYAGTAKSIDVESDLALVKINAAKLPVAKFAASDAAVQVGETVVAIGTPINFSLRNSATVGVVSGLNRAIDSSYKLIQTDAAINPGNSGGPLVNMKGEVVGINSQKFVDVNVDNMGFSIPASTVQYVLSHFFKYGKVKRPSMGIQLEESWEAIVGLPDADPMTVASVQPGSPAAKAGIEVGDVLYSVDKHDITTLVELNELFKQYVPGQKAQLMMQSNGDLVTRTIIFAEQE